MSDSDRISQLEKDIKDIKSKIRRDKKENPDYKKKEPTEYNKFIKKFCENAKKNDGAEYDHKKTFTKAAIEWGIIKKNSEDKKEDKKDNKRGDIKLI
jgi:hypothetical protein